MVVKNFIHFPRDYYKGFSRSIHLTKIHLKVGKCPLVQKNAESFFFIFNWFHKIKLENILKVRRIHYDSFAVSRRREILNSQEWIALVVKRRRPTTKAEYKHSEIYSCTPAPSAVTTCLPAGRLNESF